MALPKEKFEEIKSKIQKFIDHEMVAHEDDLSFNRKFADHLSCLLYTSPSPRDVHLSRMPSSA